MSDGLDALALLGERMAERRDYIAELERENELLAAERDEVVELLEQALGSLEREQEARREMDGHVARLLDDIDESLWWWVK